MSLRLLTLNVWALPAGLSRHVDERLDAIARALPRLDLDVIALQEVWTPSARRRLIDGAARAGLTHAWHRRSAFGGSGLMLLSRAPLFRIRFERFLARGWPERVWHGDWHGGKGFVIAELDTAQGALALVDTHLHAGYAVPDEYLGLRVAQIVQLARALRALEMPFVALGDYNSRAGEAEHSLLLALTGARDAALETGDTRPTVLADSPYRRPGHDPARIDLALVDDTPSLRVLRTMRVLDEPIRFGDEPGAYSDHAGVLTEVGIEARLEGRSPRTAPPISAVERAHALLDEGEARTLQRRRAQRAGAGAALIATGGASWARPRFDRRRLLRAALAVGGGLGATAAVGLTWLAESASARELDAFARARRDLDAMMDAQGIARVPAP